jgi:hemolysin III
MGWMALAAFHPLATSLQPAAIAWLVAGGLSYSAGAVIYACRRPNPCRLLGFHEIFHLFVIGGSASHFVLMYSYIGPL